MKKFLIILFSIPYILFAQCNNDFFVGHDRTIAKTSIAQAPIQEFNSLLELFSTLPPDEFMWNHKPKITRAYNSLRVIEENRNVLIRNVFIVAIYREDDNEFHVIISDLQGNFMNIEISGLPTPDSPYYQNLLYVRNKFKSKFGNICSVKKIKIPIRVIIVGSLFYDVDHKPGIVGPKGMKPKTSWEIHPITDIIF